MKESIVDTKILTVMFGILFIGSAAAILEFYHTPKNTERQHSYVEEEYDEDIFV